MNSTPYSTNTAEIAASACISDALLYHQHAPLLWAIAVICIISAIWAAVSLLPLAFAKDDKAPEMDNRLLFNEGYLKESLRLAELRLLEINLTIQSHEKKALAIIAGAAALVGFFLTRDSCGQLSDTLILTSIGLCVVSVWFAILTLTQMDTGYNGMDPYYFINYYHDGLSKTPPENHEDTEHPMEHMKKCALYVVMLERQQEEVTTSRLAAKRKSRNLARSTLCIVTGIISSVGWLSVMALQVTPNL